MNADRVVSVVIVGAGGRMGKALITQVLDSDNLTLAAAVDRAGAPSLGSDVGKSVGRGEVGVTLDDRLSPPRGSVVVDFSLPEATDINLQRCLEHRVPLVLGTTGLSAQQKSRLQEAARDIPIVFAANFSVGVTLLTRLAAMAAKALGEGWDAEIVELHHRHKRDAPSGTALRVAAAVAEATDRDLDAVQRLERAGETGARTDAEIGIMALRGGDAVGEHTLMFIGQSERLELTHRALDRAIFARGALRAARWIVGKDPGLYDMPDVLGL